MSLMSVVYRIRESLQHLRMWSFKITSLVCHIIFEILSLCMLLWGSSKQSWCLVSHVLFRFLISFPFSFFFLLHCSVRTMKECWRMEPNSRPAFRDFHRKLVDCAKQLQRRVRRGQHSSISTVRGQAAQANEAVALQMASRERMPTPTSGSAGASVLSADDSTFLPMEDLAKSSPSSFTRMASTPRGKRLSSSASLPPNACRRLRFSPSPPDYDSYDTIKPATGEMSRSRSLHDPKVHRVSLRTVSNAPLPSVSVSRCASKGRSKLGTSPSGVSIAPTLPPVIGSPSHGSPTHGEMKRVPRLEEYMDMASCEAAQQGHEARFFSACARPKQPTLMKSVSFEDAGDRAETRDSGDYCEMSPDPDIRYVNLKPKAEVAPQQNQASNGDDYCEMTVAFKGPVGKPKSLQPVVAFSRTTSSVRGGSDNAQNRTYENASGHRRRLTDLHKAPCAIRLPNADDLPPPPTPTPLCERRRVDALPNLPEAVYEGLNHIDNECLHYCSAPIFIPGHHRMRQTSISSECSVYSYGSGRPLLSGSASVGSASLDASYGSVSTDIDTNLNDGESPNRSRSNALKGAAKERHPRFPAPSPLAGSAEAEEPELPPPEPMPSSPGGVTEPPQCPTADGLPPPLPEEAKEEPSCPLDLPDPPPELQMEWSSVHVCVCVTCLCVCLRLCCCAILAFPRKPPSKNSTNFLLLLSGRLVFLFLSHWRRSVIIPFLTAIFMIVKHSSVINYTVRLTGGVIHSAPVFMAYIYILMQFLSWIFCYMWRCFSPGFSWLWSLFISFSAGIISAAIHDVNSIHCVMDCSSVQLCSVFWKWSWNTQDCVVVDQLGWLTEYHAFCGSCLLWSCALLFLFMAPTWTSCLKIENRETFSNGTHWLSPLDSSGFARCFLLGIEHWLCSWGLGIFGTHLTTNLWS